MDLYPSEHETIEGVGRAIRAGKATCAEVLNHCLVRVDAREPEIRAWVVLDREAAHDQARALDAELAAGRCRGPLHGIPVGIKDIIDVAGLPTAAGFGPWRDRRAEADAPLVRALRDAGAVILGKTATTQFAWVDPPPTRNPWDPGRTPGGSSSGSAAAVASGMCLGALGTQTGGSIIRPASFCGVCGLKPSKGRLGVGGIVPFAPSLDHPGPIARSTRDLALLLRDLDGPHPPVKMPDFHPPSEVDEWLPRLLPGRGRPPRLVRPRGFHDRRADPAMLAAFERALADLAAAGAEVVEADDAGFDFDAILRDHRIVMAAEAAEGHEARFREHGSAYSPRIRSLVEEGLSVPATAYLRAKRGLRGYIARARQALPSGEAFDALATPATIGPAPGPDTTGDPAFNSAWSYLGWPAVSFPVGLSPDGLPLAIQLVGAGPFDEYDLLVTASWCEDVIRRAFPASARSD
jgi:aspartyl-tRNA(Asn)/glutamyl-tRNA(Gln) amidotransferase subunit A